MGSSYETTNESIPPSSPGAITALLEVIFSRLYSCCPYCTIGDEMEGCEAVKLALPLAGRHELTHFACWLFMAFHNFLTPPPVWSAVCADTREQFRNLYNYMLLVRAGKMGRQAGPPPAVRYISHCHFCWGLDFTKCQFQGLILDNWYVVFPFRLPIKATACGRRGAFNLALSSVMDILPWRVGTSCIGCHGSQ